jgi:hypothetical protein
MHDKRSNIGARNYYGGTYVHDEGQPGWHSTIPFRTNENVGTQVIYTNWPFSLFCSCQFAVNVEL